ncbi:MAG: hypothetical protein Kow002_00160 [Anaerolineales bacterium]
MRSKSQNWLLSIGLLAAMAYASAEVRDLLGILQTWEKWRSPLGLATIFTYLVIFFAGLAVLWAPEEILLPKLTKQFRWLLVIFLLASISWTYLYSPWQNALTGIWIQFVFAAGLTALISRILNPDSKSSFNLSHLTLTLSLFLYPRIVHEMRDLSSLALTYRLVTFGGLALNIALVMALFGGIHQSLGDKLIGWRNDLGKIRWLFVALLLLLPLGYRYLVGVEIYVLYPSLRFSVWTLSFWGLGFLLETEAGRMVRLEAAGLSAGALTLVAFLVKALLFVTDYPFMLYWSEGNRFYDYSLIFGQALYDYPGLIDNPYDSPGRYGLWGVLFLWQGLPIWAHRLWNVLLQFIMPLLLAFFLTRKFDRKLVRWGLFLWIAVFFTVMVQLHMPFMLVGIIVAAFAFDKSPLKRGLALSVASFYAGLSRWTQVWAPGAWGVLIDLLFFYPKRKGNLFQRLWPTVVQALFGLVPGLALSVSAYLGLSSGTLITAKQPLLWYRLLPNETLGPGIVLLALMVAGPPLALLLWQILSNRWSLDWLQKTAIFGVLAGFFAVGLVISTKIGGGGDLHNLDMFLMTLVFLIALALYQRQETLNLRTWPVPALVLIWLMVLTPVLKFSPFDPNAAYSFRLDLPKASETEEALQVVQAQVQRAAREGEVLFMDQRQLLTFGYIQNIPLVPEYEKKYMMDQAMGSNAAYFADYYADLASQRFTLIVSEPLKPILKEDMGGPFSEENDAWTIWVAAPTLCYYEPIYTSKEVYVQLLAPRENPENCKAVLP